MQKYFRERTFVAQAEKAQCDPFTGSITAYSSAFRLPSSAFWSENPSRWPRRRPVSIYLRTGASLIASPPCVAGAHRECSAPADSRTQPVQLSRQTSFLATWTRCLTCRFFGWTKANEITNGRWVMFGFAVGLLTEFATGVDFPHQCALF